MKKAGRDVGTQGGNSPDPALAGGHLCPVGGARHGGRNRDRDPRARQQGSRTTRGTPADEVEQGRAGPATQREIGENGVQRVPEHIAGQRAASRPLEHWGVDRDFWALATRSEVGLSATAWAARRGSEIVLTMRGYAADRLGACSRSPRRLPPGLGDAALAGCSVPPADGLAERPGTGWADSCDAARIRRWARGATRIRIPHRVVREPDILGANQVILNSHSSTVDTRRTAGW